jgi:hypothetical protein
VEEKVPNTKRRLTRSERAERLRTAEELRAQGVDIVIPPEWRENSSPIEIMIASPHDCLVWNRSGGQTYYCVYLQICARRSGLLYPEFDLEVPWDSGIVLERFEPITKKGVGFKAVMNFKQGLDFGGQRYWGEEILNRRIADGERLPSGRLIYGFLLATGLRRIPAEYGERALVPLHLIVRDQISGDIMQTVQADLAVVRGREPKCTVPFVPEGLYAPEPPPPTTEKQPEPSFSFKSKQRIDQIMQYAQLRRMEKAREAIERRQEKAAWRKLQQEITDSYVDWTRKQKQPSSIEPNHSVPPSFEVDENRVVASASDKNRTDSHDPCE